VSVVVVGVVAGGPVLIGAQVGFVQNPSIYDRKGLPVVWEKLRSVESQAEAASSYAVGT
jgi:hypothetical protein